MATLPTSNLINGIAASLATRFDVPVAVVRPHLNSALVEEWGKIRRIDSDAGDTISTSSLSPANDDRRDATYVRVCARFHLDYEVLQNN